MTKTIDVTINNKVFEVSIVIQDDKGQRVRLPKDFFKNADPASFVTLSQNLLKSFDKRSQITWVDGTGVVYKKNPDSSEELSDKQKAEWDKVEDYILKRFSSLPPEAFNEDEEDAAAELDAAQPVRHGGTPRQPAPNTTEAPIISGQPQVELGVGKDPIVSPDTQIAPPGVRHPHAARLDTTTAQNKDADDHTLPCVPATVNHNDELNQAQRLEDQANPASDSRTPSYRENVRKVIDTFLDWVLRKLRAGA